MKKNEQQILKEIYSPVKLVDTVDILSNTDALLMPYNNKAVVVTKPDGKDMVVNFCSDIYGLIPNTEIFPKIEEMLGQHFSYKASYKHWNFSKFYVDYEITGKETYIGKARFADEVRPMIRIMHSYNGQLRYRAAMGFRRQVCINGLWGYVNDVDFVLKHTTENLVEILEKTIEGVVGFIDKVEEFKMNYELLTNVKVNLVEERVDQILEKVPLFPKRQRGEVINRINHEHSQGLPLTDWLIYNGFNFQLNHNENIKSQDDQKMVLDRKIFEVIAKTEQPKLEMA